MPSLLHEKSLIISNWNCWTNFGINVTLYNSKLNILNEKLNIFMNDFCQKLSTKNSTLFCDLKRHWSDFFSWCKYIQFILKSTEYILSYKLRFTQFEAVDKQSMGHHKRSKGPNKINLNLENIHKESDNQIWISANIFWVLSKQRFENVTKSFGHELSNVTGLTTGPDEISYNSKTTWPYL